MTPGDRPDKMEFRNWFSHALGLEHIGETLAKRKQGTSNLWHVAA